MIRGLAVATAFLTRVPLRVPVASDQDLARAMPWFPVVGGVVGAVVGGAAWVGLRIGLPALVAAGLGVALGMILTGALHEDGLADTLDALGGRSDREQALRIMSDSRLGTFGVAGLVVALVLRIVALSSLPSQMLMPGAITAHAVGRTAALGLMVLARPASVTGLGAAYFRAVRPAGAALGVALGLGIAAVLVGAAALPVATVVGLAVLFVGRWSHRRLGGVTGDVLGAGVVVTEVGVLVTLSMPVVQGWLPG